ncbi:hypothetical protein J6590_049700, partial [Homalodisca vitripennis]
MTSSCSHDPTRTRTDRLLPADCSTVAQLCAHARVEGGGRNKYLLTPLTPRVTGGLLPFGDFSVGPSNFHGV